MEVKIALAGNPNSGKTTLFNALTGSTQYVGNWPGVTVEKKEGKLKKHDDVTITDLPGIYSLSPYTLEEVVARNYLIDHRPDAILNIVDGTNLERNLYLTTQLTELGIPVVVAVNMMDLVRKKGDSINIKELSRQLGCPVLEISALKGEGVQEAAEAAIEASKGGKTVPQHKFSGPVDHAIAHIEEAALHGLPEEQQRWYAVKIFERDEKVLEKLNIDKEILAHIEQDIKAAEAELEDDAESIITNERYVYIAQMLKGIYKKKEVHKLSNSDKIDRIVTNRILALPIFAAVMYLVYALSMGKSIADGGISIGTFLTDWANDVLGGAWLTDGSRALLEGWGVAGWLVGLISDGICAGVGAVLGFVPQMLVLFLLLAILEDCGYMARIAFIMDRIFRKFGLSGKSFIPMLVGTAHDHHDHLLHPLRGENAHHRPHRGRSLRRQHLDRSIRLFHRRGCHHRLRHHAEKDQDVRGRPCPLRHGAARLPRPQHRECAAQHVGAGLELHQAGRNGHPPEQRRDLGPQQPGRRQRPLRHGG